MTFQKNFISLKTHERDVKNYVKVLQENDMKKLLRN